MTSRDESGRTFATMAEAIIDLHQGVVEEKDAEIKRLRSVIEDAIFCLTADRKTDKSSRPDTALYRLRKAVER